MRSKSEPTFVEQARRRQILDGAIQLIAEQGFVNASIARIAEQVGVAKSAVLYYFATKDDLVTAIVGRVMGGAAEAMVPALLAEESATGKLCAYIRSNCAFLDGHRTESVAMFEAMTSYRTPDGLRLDQAIGRDVEEHPPPPEMSLLDPLWIIQEGVRKGEFRALDPSFAADALRGALDGAVSELARNSSYDVVAYGELLVTIFGEALSGARGRFS